MLVAGCSVRQSQLPGTYELQFDGGRSVLEIKQDGTFSQEVVAERTFRLTGKWTFDGKYLRLSPGFIVAQNNAGLQQDSVWLPVSRSWGTVDIETDPNFGLSYRKK